MNRRALPIALLLLAVLAGCTGIQGTIDHPFDEDPDDDRIGWEDGYWYDESVSVTTEDGLNASEREIVLARTKARVEHLRDREFDGNVSVEVISRAQYRNRSVGFGVEDDPWNDQVWEALVLVGEDRAVEDAFQSTLNSSVQGYYSPGSDDIVLVSDSPTPSVDRATLAHELVHALQDQQMALGASPPTQDRQLARQSVTEGEANLVESLYERRCGQDWACIPQPERQTTSSGGDVDGVFLVIFQPYATGPSFVQQVREDGGWDAVDALYESPPNSTEQVIHADAYPDEEPESVTVRDRSNDEWSRFDHDPVADTVGEASIYAMFAANGVLDTDQESRYRYRSEPSAGWAGDAVVPYQAGSDRYGYVWKTRWDTDRDARQFHETYRRLLTERDGVSQSGNVYVLPESDPYGDAFRVVRDGKTVRIVNAPTRDALDDVHAPAGE